MKAIVFFRNMLCVPICLLSIMLLTACGLQSLRGDEIICTSSSPDHSYTITAYLNNGGATTDFAVLCRVKNNHTQKERNIYWQYHCDYADIMWKDNFIVVINGIELDVRSDSYDYRKISS